MINKITQILFFIYIDGIVLRNIIRFNSFVWLNDFYISVMATDYNRTSFFVDYYRKK